jgi:hypothetical protein
MYNLPTYIKNEKYNSQKLNEIIKTGEVKNKIDSSNVYSISFDDEESDIDPGNHLVSVPMKKTEVNNSHVGTYYSTEFQEFTSVEGDVEELSVEDMVSELENTQIEKNEEEQLLQAQIEELSNIVDIEMQKNVRFQETSSEMYRAAKDLIISQRVKAGEGKAVEDFSEKFPFLPISLEDGEQEDRVDQFPFMSEP